MRHDLLESNPKLLHADVTHEIIGSFYDVYNYLGTGFAESVYANALPLALAKRGVRYEREKPLTVKYRGVVVGEFRVDMVVEGEVVVELKAAEQIGAAHEAQLLNYLRASGLTVGLILNFGPKAGTRRVVWNGKRVEFADLNNG